MYTNHEHINPPSHTNISWMNSARPTSCFCLFLSPYSFTSVILQIIWLRNSNQSFRVQTRYRENIEFISIESMRILANNVRISCVLWSMEYIKMNTQNFFSIMNAFNWIPSYLIQWIWFDRFHSYIFILFPRLKEYIRTRTYSLK